MDKERIDVLLVDKGLVKSRAKAKEYIKSGCIFVNNEKITKSSMKISPDIDIVIKGNPIPFVSRGGLKLDKALDEFGISVNDKIVLDIGASTGGFTDCMLKRGARKVYAIDVGTDQLSSELRNDSRVVSMENTNVRNMSPDDIEEKGQFACIDVSFISLRLILPVIITLTSSDADIVALIKPQFEAGKDRIGKHGIVKNSKIHKEILQELYDFCKEKGLYFRNLTFSPVKGGSGNIEYLTHISKTQDDSVNFRELIDNVVDTSHNILK